MQSQKIPYDKSILVCVNNQQGEKPSCGDHRGEEVFKELRRIAKERGLHPKVRVTQVKCLGQCNQGVNIMVYPDGIWHNGAQLNDVENISDKYLSTEKSD